MPFTVNNVRALVMNQASAFPETYIGVGDKGGVEWLP